MVVSVIYLYDCYSSVYIDVYICPRVYDGYVHGYLYGRMHGMHQERPYNNDSTASRLLSEVKHCLAWLVLRWGTTLEY